MNVGRALVLLLVLVGAAGAAISGAAFYYHFLYMGLILAAASWLSVHWLARGLRLTRHPDFTRASVGDIYKEQYEVRNTSRIPGGWVELLNDMPLPMAAGSRLLTRVRPREKQSFVARTWLTRRGGFPIGPTRLVVSDALGLFTAERVFPAEKTLVVLPMVFPLQNVQQPPGLLPGGQVIRRRSVEITPHASGVRPYVAGDPMRRIHWPTSARRGQLIVKEFEQDPQAEVWIFLDAHKNVHIARSGEQYSTPPLDDLLLIRRRKVKLTPSTLEYSISITASLAHYFIEQRRSVGVVTASENAYEVIPAERSERQEGKILEALAFLQGESTITLPSLISAQIGQLPQGSSAILVTPMAWTELLLAVDSLQRRNLRPVVVLLMAQSFGGRHSNEELARSLAERNVPVCPVYCEADLSETLSSFSANTFSQESSWRRPVLSHLT
jgi:uncharacterized protein (DUF58 family)